ncbi:ThuA domain-containing protein [Shewanella sp. 10N.286.51.B8]|uniref:ThuA domain-containing protein n=1 Tax=Shewanella sp. 10N.286.51.B8 TaxID=3229708 RepID=UPI00354EA9FD
MHKFLLVVFIAIVGFNHQHSHATGFETLAAKQFNVLLFTKTAGWHHKSIPAGVTAFEKLAEKHYFNLIWHEESHYFNDEYLSKVDVVVFLSTTGDILSNEQQQALERYIQSGKGFVGIHSASDTEYDWGWYQQLVGHTFVIHPVVQTAWLSKVSSEFPGLESMPEKMLWTDEWYEFGEANSTGLNYLLTVDETSYNPNADWGTKQGSGMGDFHPIAWYHNFDGGRSFYTSLGHIKPVYQNKLFLDHLYGGLYWAATGKGIVD